MCVGSSSSVNSPVTFPPNNSNLPPGCAPVKFFGGDRVKAASRWGSVNVWKSSAAVVRNSVLSVMVTVLTSFPELAWVAVAETCGPLALLTEELS